MNKDIKVKQYTFAYLGMRQGVFNKKYLFVAVDKVLIELHQLSQVLCIII